MFLVLLAAAAAILVGVVAVVMGRGGEITQFGRDLPAARFGLRTPSDVALLRLPISLFGFQPHATDGALREIASLLADRDAEIARLRDDVRQFGMRTISEPASREYPPSQPASAADPADGAGATGPGGGVDAGGAADPAGAAGAAGTAGRAGAAGAAGGADAGGAEDQAGAAGAAGSAGGAGATEPSGAGGVAGSWARSQP